jgi:predicted nuclease of predicted toxin-antitoxin system
MKILADENIPRMTVEWLRSVGHGVRDVRGTPEQGAADIRLWDLALSKQRTLVTTDEGFTEHRAEPHYGILVVRLRQPNRVQIHSAVANAMTRFPDSEWPNLLVVIRDRTMSTSRGRHSA